MITQQELQNMFEYQEDTGKLIWKVKLSNRTNVGKEAGVLTKEGYVRVRINKKLYMAHRLIWCMKYGRFPEYEIDHKDGNRSNNAFNNLRSVNKTENLHNRTKSNGYYFCNTRKKFVAAIKINYKRCFLGYFDNEQDAREAYLKAKNCNGFYFHNEGK